ncbi:MAG TPA: hypothetical protein VKS79_11620 [Gemmataceae bacterium]|nr:hypothetical protein [Gemmataceae bacterium]
MKRKIPNLWQSGEDARRLYSLFLSRLELGCKYKRMVFACRQIRRYARGGPGSDAGLFTFGPEIDALCGLKKYGVAWRQLRYYEVRVFGHHLKCDRPKLSTADAMVCSIYHVPLLYFLGRYEKGRNLLEKCLDQWFRVKRRRSYDIMYLVSNLYRRPLFRCTVTLAHFYQRLGTDLREWRHWAAFVKGFHPGLFSRAPVSQEELLADSSALGPFLEHLSNLHSERVTSGVGGGQSYLIDSPAKVAKRQKALQEKLDDFYRSMRGVIDSTNAKLEQLFPELQELS